MRLRMRRLFCSSRVSCSFLGMTICLWERSPITTALSASRFTETCNDVGIAFWPPLSAPTSEKYNGVAIDLIQVHCRITQREELVPGLESGKPGYLLACLQPTKESFHGLIKSEKHFMQELPIYVL